MSDEAQARHVFVGMGGNTLVYTHKAYLGLTTSFESMAVANDGVASESDEDDEFETTYETSFVSMVDCKWNKAIWQGSLDVPASLRAKYDKVDDAFGDLQRILLEPDATINTHFLTHKTHMAMERINLLSNGLYAVARPGAPLTDIHKMLHVVVRALRDWIVQCGFRQHWDTAMIEHEYIVSRKMNMPNLFDTVVRPAWDALGGIAFPLRFQDRMEQVRHDVSNLEHAACVDVDVAEVLETAQILVLRLNGFTLYLRRDEASHPQWRLLFDLGSAVGRLIKQSGLILEEEENGNCTGLATYTRLYNRKYKNRRPGKRNAGANVGTCSVSLPLPRSYEVPFL